MNWNINNTHTQRIDMPKEEGVICEARKNRTCSETRNFLTIVWKQSGKNRNCKVLLLVMLAAELLH